jgi:hypothetical protein
MRRRRGRPSNADKAAARAANGNADAGNATGNATGSDQQAPGEIQDSIKAEPGSVDISQLNPGFTAAAEGPIEAGPGATVEPTTGAEIRRGPGRPRGATRKPVSASGVETLLLGIHSTLHAVFKAEELSLDKEEARLLAQSYADVAEHYPVLNFDPKYAALANFAGTISLVYGSKIAAFRMRRAFAPRGSVRQQPMPQAPRQPQQTPVPDGAQFMTPEINGVDQNAPNAKREVPAEAKTSIIPGVGTVQFPDDHPMINGKPN